MPAYESAGSLMLHFGTGDICIVTGVNRDDKHPELAFVVDEPGEIGRERPQFLGKSTQDLPCPVRLRFDNLASLAVLEDAVQKLRKAMEEHGITGSTTAEKGPEN